MQPFLGCGFITHISEEVVNASILIPWSMRISYFLEALMGLAILIVISIFIGAANAMFTLQDFAAVMLRTPLAPVAYLLAIILLVLFVMRSVTLLATVARQLLAFGRSSESKAFNFLDETDGSPSPRTAVVVAAILTAGVSTLSLLRDYRILFEHIRRLGILCTLTSHLICIGSLCVYRCWDEHTSTPTNENSARKRSFRILVLTINWIAFGFCLLLIVFANFPSELPMTWANAPWSLALWVCLVLYLITWYRMSAHVDFLAEDSLVRVQQETSVIAMENIKPTGPKISTSARLVRPISEAFNEAIRSLESKEEVDLSQHKFSRRSSTPEWIKKRPISKCEFDDMGSQQVQHRKGKGRVQGCLEPSKCPGNFYIPDVGSSRSSGPRCDNCEAH